MCVSVALCLHLRSHTPDSAAGSHSYLPAFPPVTGRCCPGATERVWRRRHSGTVCPVLLRCGVSLSSVPGGQRSPVFYERVRKELFATLSLIRLLLLLLLLLPLLLSYAALCSLLSVTCSLVRLLARTPRARGGPRFRFQKCFRPSAVFSSPRCRVAQTAVRVRGNRCAGCGYTWEQRQAVSGGGGPRTGRGPLH